jgi:hypothetical protein
MQQNAEVGLFAKPSSFDSTGKEGTFFASVVERSKKSG